MVRAGRARVGPEVCRADGPTTPLLALCLHHNRGPCPAGAEAVPEVRVDTGLVPQAWT